MVDLNHIPVNGGEDLTARTGRERTGCGILRRASSLFALFLGHAPFIDQSVYPILRGAPGNIRPSLDIMYSKISRFKGQCPHQVQEFPSPLNDTLHGVP
jgi:hypothetical protein